MLHFVYSNHRKNIEAKLLREHFNKLSCLLETEDFKSAPSSFRIGAAGSIKAHLRDDIRILHASYDQAISPNELHSCNIFYVSGNNRDEILQLLRNLRDFYENFQYETSCLDSPFHDE